MVAFLVPAPLFEKLPHVLAAGLSAESLAHKASHLLTALMSMLDPQPPPHCGRSQPSPPMILVIRASLAWF